MAGTPDLMRALDEMRKAAPDYEMAEEFAEGKGSQEDFLNPRIRRLFAKAGVECIEGFGYSEIPIRVISSRLRMLTPTATRVGSDAPAEQAAAQLDTLWTDNELAGTMKDAFRLVSTFGDAYLFVWPVVERPVPAADEDAEPGDSDLDEGEDDAPEPAETVVGVDLMVNNPKIVRAVYGADDTLHPRYVIKQWETDDGGRRANLYYPDHVEKWTADAGSTFTSREAWYRTTEHEQDVPTPLGVLPWFHLRNGRPYGAPEHRRAYGPQKMINKVIAALLAIVDYQVGPTRYYLADPTIDDPHANLTNPDWPDDDDDDPGSGESPLSSDPNAVWKLYGRDAGQFEPANPDNLIKPLQQAIRCMADLTGLPAFHFGWGTGDTPSGAALRTLDSPTGNIVDDRKDTYSPTLARSLGHALLLLGHRDVRVQVRWAPTTTITDLEGWQILGLKIAAGVPVEQVLIEAGYLPEQASEWVRDAAGADIGRRLALLTQLAAIVAAVKGTDTGGGPVPPQLAANAANPPALPPTPNTPGAGGREPDGKPNPADGGKPAPSAVPVQPVGGIQPAPVNLPAPEKKTPLVDIETFADVIKELVTAIMAGMEDGEAS